MSDDTVKPPVYRRIWLRSVAAAGGTLALMVTWALDVQQRREARALPDVPPGTAVDAGAYLVSLNSATLSDLLPDGTATPGGVPMMMVSGRIENLTSASRNDMRALLSAGNAASQFYLTEDRSLLGSLEPRMAKNVTLVLPAPAGDKARITLMGRRYKARDNLSGAGGWFDARPVAVVTLPVAADGVGR